MTGEPDPYLTYVAELIRTGHDRFWILRNEPALRARFARDDTPFPPLIDRDRQPWRHRYDEL